MQPRALPLVTRVLIDLMAFGKVSAVGHLPNYMSSFSEDQSAICGALFRDNDGKRFGAQQALLPNCG